jgi:hypothetical protein
MKLFGIFIFPNFPTHPRHFCLFKKAKNSLQDTFWTTHLQLFCVIGLILARKLTPWLLFNSFWIINFDRIFELPKNSFIDLNTICHIYVQLCILSTINFSKLKVRRSFGMFENSLLELILFRHFHFSLTVSKNSNN